MRRAGPATGRQRGIALIMVLWGVAALSLLVGRFTADTTTQTNLARNIVASAQAEALADAGVHRMILELAKPDGLRRVRLDGTAYRWVFDGGEVLLRVEDERGKIDLNAAADDILRALLASAGLSAADAAILADRVIDFRDRDSEPLAGGAEDADYLAAGLLYRAKDAPFEAVDELESVLGMTGLLFARLAPAVTVFSGFEAPLWEVMPPSLAARLAPFVEGLAAAGPAERLSLDGRDPGLDAVPFRQLEEAAAIGEADLAVPVGSVFTIHAEARTAAGTYFARDAVVEVVGGPDSPFTVLDWRQGRRSLMPEESPTERS